MMRQRQVSAPRTGASVLGCAFILGMVACGSEATPGDDFETVHRDSSIGSGLVQANEAALSAVSSCDVLLADLQGDLIEQVHAVAEQARLSPDYYYYGGGVFLGDVQPAPVASAPVGAPTQSAGIASPAIASGQASALAAPALAPASPFAGGGFSQTTVQVPGVDEADFVKAEGDRIYLVQGNSIYVLDAADASATQVVSSLALEGSPSELFVRNGQVVVLSNVSGPLPGQEEDPYNYNYYYYPNYAKLTVLDASGDSISVLRESYVEGYSNGSRRHDSVVRSLVQQSSKAQLDYPAVSYFDIFGNRRSQAEIDLQVDLWVLLTVESIEDSVVEDYLPSIFERAGGELVEQPVRCEDYLVPGPGLINAGATNIVTLDLEALDAPLGTTTLIGYAEGVYANDDVLLIRQTEYGDFTQPSFSINTNVHRFELDGAATTYTASGSVSGYVATSFGLDEAAGVIRAVTIVEEYGVETIDGVEYPVYVGATNHVVTLGQDGAALVELGRSPDFGGDGYLSTARFVGDYAYVTVYDVAGNLFVADVSDPAAPAIVGQTSINGYTGQLVPFGSDELLTLSQIIDPTGQTSDIALQLFDVANPAEPSVSREYVFPEAGYSEAMYDIRAFSFHPERNLLSFPFTSYTTGQSTLEVFNVPESGSLQRVASIEPSSHEPTLLECLSFLGYPTDPEFLQLLEDQPELAESLLTECGYYFVASARRGLFRGDDLFAVHTLGVDAYSVYTLSGPPLSEVDLPPANPYYYGYPYYVGAPGVAVAGTAPAPVPDGE